MKLLLCALAIMVLCGCQTVPETDITLNLKTGLLHIKSPKQFDAEDLKAEIDANGMAKVSFKKLRSRNDSDVIGTVAAANAVMADKLVEVINTGKAGAMNSVVPIP